MHEPRCFGAEVTRLKAAAVTGPGETFAELRTAVAARASALALGEPGPAVPQEVEAYVDKVALHAYKVVDADVEALKEGGLSEDEIFELTVAAAVGSALVRLDRGLAALAEGSE
jgi:alkylhydroperoxidase family enzyme